MFEKLVSAPRNLINFYGDVKTELKKVTWPNKKEVYGTTIVVVATVIFFGFYLFLVDIVLKQAIEWVFATFR